MEIPPIQQLELAAKKLVWVAQEDGNLSALTPRLIRQTIEKQFSLEEGTLDASEYRSALKAATKYAIANEPSAEDETDPKTSPVPNKKRKSDGTLKSEVKEASATKQRPKPGPKSRGKKKEKAPTNDAEASNADMPKKKHKVTPKSKKIMSDEEEDDHKADGVSPGKKPNAANAKRKKAISEDEDTEEEAPRISSVKPKTKQDSRMYKSAEHVATSDIEEDEPHTAEAQKPEVKKQLTSLPVPSATETTPRKKEVPSKVQKAEPSKSADIDMEDAVKSESELSVLIDEPPKRKKSSTKDKAPKEKSKLKKSAKSSAALSKDEETIKRLKSLVVACGIRRPWSKVFEGLDAPQQQIKKLKQMLAELGMTGRLSMEQARAIKEKRELEKELADVQEFAEKMESRSSRSRANANTKSNVAEEPEDESSEDDDEVEAPRKRAMNARKSINAFLGDQSDEE